MLIWLTGLSGAGKTTLGEHLVRLLESAGHRAELLDGDAVRRQLCRDLGYSKGDRDENIRRIGFVAGLLVKHGIVVVVSAISPYRETRDEIRARFTNFIEVYVNAPVEVCELRDRKGLYRRARTGELPEFTGVSGPYEAPLHPEIECRTDLETIEQSVGKIFEYVGCCLSDRREASKAVAP